MSFSTQHRTGYPAITRREAHALAQAREALYAVAERAKRSTWRGEPDTIRNHAIVSERADVARDALTSFLIAAEVHLEAPQARAALDRS